MSEEDNPHVIVAKLSELLMQSVCDGKNLSNFSPRIDKVKMLCLRFILALLAPTFVHGLSRASQTDFGAVNFARLIKGMKLIGNVIKETGVTEEESCQLECVKDSKCLSYNLKATINKKTLNCQLSDSDRFQSLKNFSKDDESVYRGIQVLPYVL